MARALVNAVLAQETAEAVSAQQWRIIADQLREKVPKLSAMLDDAESEVLAYMQFPKSTSRSDRLDEPTETVERRNKTPHQCCEDLSRRSGHRAWSALCFWDKNDEWQLQRRYMQLEGLQTVSDNTLHRIAAVVIA